MKSAQPLTFALSNSVLVNGNGAPLSQQELLTCWQFVNLFAGSRYATLILRGESDENLTAQYGYDTAAPELLAQCLFMVGEKGRNCWTERQFPDPGKTSPQDFGAICRALAGFIREGCRGKSLRGQRIAAFCDRNRPFCEAFERIDALVEAYAALAPEEREQANLYYLSIAHALNSQAYKKASGFVSATTDPQVADHFADDATIYGWVPNAATRVARTGRTTTIDYVASGSRALIERLGLPVCKTPPYPEQKEVALRGGLLPHFIIGFKAKRRFYVNPALFESMARLAEQRSWRELMRFRRELLLEGLSIDQTNFAEFCRRTNLRRYYTFDGTRYELHDLY